MPLISPIQGLKENIDKDGENVYSIFKLLNDINNFEPFDLKDKKVVVISGGAVGLDVVEFFSKREAEVVNIRDSWIART